MMNRTLGRHCHMFGLFILLIFHVFASSNPDRVKYMPGLWPPETFAHYSGYVDGSTSNIKIHYWLVESLSEPSKAPLVLWLNGGPGCSSLEGLLSENGPFTIVDGPKLVHNPYSWNTFANVLYLEAPAGVGFSYAVDGNVTTNDDMTALDNYHALLNFMKKYPEYQGRDFYVTGESYAGVYVPTLTLRLLEKPIGLNLKGIAVGNGLTSYLFNDNSLVYFLNYHGFVDEPMWNKLLTLCCPSGSSEKCMFTENKSYDCQKLVYHITVDMIEGLNVYNMFSLCAGGASSAGLARIVQKPMPHLVHADFGNNLRGNVFMDMQRYLVSSIRKNYTKTRLQLPCVDDRSILEYLNTPLVQQALHVDAPVGRDHLVWDICSDEVNTRYGRVYRALQPQYTKILENKISTLIYNGDTDMACNFYGGEWFVDSLNLTPFKPHDRWLYEYKDHTEQVGGLRKVMKHPDTKTSLTFATVRGSGHMVPEDRPISSLHMITQFVRYGFLL